MKFQEFISMIGEWTLVIILAAICWGIPLLIITALVKWAFMFLFGG